MNALQPSLTKDSQGIVENNGKKVYEVFINCLESGDNELTLLVGDNLAIMLQSCSKEQLAPFSKLVLII